MDNFWLKSIIEEFGLNFNQTLEQVWTKEGMFIGYPKIIENMMSELLICKKDFFQKDKNAEILNIVKHIPEIDPLTGLYFDFNKYNLYLIQSYQNLLSKQKSLKPISITNRS